MSTLALLALVILGPPLLGDATSGAERGTEVLGVQESRDATASDDPDRGDPGAADVTFAISGRLEGAGPGGPSALLLTVTHEHPFAITVRTIDVRVGDPIRDATSGPPCLADHLEVADLPGAQRVDPRSAVTIELPAVLASDAPDACLTADFPLSFSGTAVRDERP